MPIHDACVTSARKRIAPERFKLSSLFVPFDTKPFKFTHNPHNILRGGFVVNITLAVPSEMKNEMERFPEINWSEIARAAIKERLEMLVKFKKFTEQSTFTEKEAVTLGRQLKQRV